jgi:hypothetical protein
MRGAGIRNFIDKFVQAATLGNLLGNFQVESPPEK